MQYDHTRETLFEIKQYGRGILPRVFSPVFIVRGMPVISCVFQQLSEVHELYYLHCCCTVIGESNSGLCDLEGRLVIIL